MRWRFLLSGLCAASLLTACSGNDNRLVPLTLDMPANPAQGKAVRIATVADSRIFELKPRQPHIPSLLPEDFDKFETRQRAIGRQRDAFGKATGEVLLPEGQSVTALFRDATTQAFRQSGYRVLSPGEPGFDEAAPITVTVRDYWNWVPAATTGRASCRAEASVQASFPPFKDGLVIAGLAQQESHLNKPGESPGDNTAPKAFMDTDWRNVAGRCLAAYSDNLKAMLMR